MESTISKTIVNLLKILPNNDNEVHFYTPNITEEKPPFSKVRHYFDRVFEFKQQHKHKHQRKLIFSLDVFSVSCLFSFGSLRSLARSFIHSNFQCAFVWILIAFLLQHFVPYFTSFHFSFVRLLFILIDYAHSTDTLTRHFYSMYLLLLCNTSTTQFLFYTNE